MGFNTTKIITPTRALTAEGGPGFTRDTKMELYSLLVTSLLSGDSFYEKGEERLNRLKSLISSVMQMKDGATFLIGLAVYARDYMYLRSSPTMLSAELFVNKVEGANKVAKIVWARGDEHLEALAYLKNQGIRRPKQMLKSIADKLNTMSVYSLVKYQASNKTFTQRDALRLAHPIPSNPKQSAIFKYITQGWDKLTDSEKTLLPEVSSMKAGNSFTWEQQISTQGSTKDTWEQAIPKMGYMALLRNLRNFLEKNVGRATIEQVAKTLSDPEQVRRSKQLPYRFLSAYYALQPLPESQERNILGKAIRDALNVSVDNVPELEGDTLILMDVSGSMQTPLANKPNKPTFGSYGSSPGGTIQLTHIAALLGSIISTKIQGEAWAFATSSQKCQFGPGDDILQKVNKVYGMQLGGGTNMGEALTKALKRSKPFRRVIILTDMQAMDDVWNPIREYRTKNPNFSAYVIDLQGYRVSCLPKGNGCYQLAGFSDRVFNWISEEEATNNAVIEKITKFGNDVLKGTYTGPNKKVQVIEEEAE